ncbi:N-acetyl-gamma-glutamyl-phosphate reductase [Candidatus Oleimmundimicrobium sp.]|uniref:N-acetyl-gamma-glutamyl-phosphate reductase n=1 Tax=Candidatus Oleimmundimicrobium sp. TaxID=3060597 RepID=UPI0027211208|nr:N-acetyl-gamma-glutamyl-phosphate reductase [Candidatus Oleimmundimicrobium sp.]MDO8886345.1 N-acetyl-gamma-glutamyl-phosphate reductase [Candidatus Oleimmundimicrobium sp.]
MINVGIIGASGYTGAELLRLLTNHSEVKISYVTANKYAGQKVSALYPNFYGICDLMFEKFDSDIAKKKAEVFFVALPHGTSMNVVPELLGENRKVIDLSGDFRFPKKDVYESWYKMPHKHPELLGSAVYGLCEINREKIKGSDFISNPGCFPTGSILAVAPLLKEEIISESDIIIDALTGVSGAGRSANKETHYCSCDENVNSYKVGGTHQHIPETEQEMSKISNKEVKLTFTPHLASFSRGIYSTIYCKLKKDISTEELLKTYNDFYKNHYFIKILPKGVYPEIKSVAGSNFCQIGLEVDERTGRVIVISAIDNLVKGASGQAIQNMNLMCGFDEKEGLKAVGLVP